MRVRITHTTRYDYAQPAVGSFTEVRLTPRNTENQNLLGFELMVIPSVRPVASTDHFGTIVQAFNVWAPHRSLVVTSMSDVVTYPRLQPPMDAGDLAALEDPDLRDAQAEWLYPSALASGGDHLGSFAAHVRATVKPASVTELVHGVSHEVHGRFSYRSGSSYVTSTVDDLLERGTGVCQDFAHLAIAALRSLGVPARYVSGYFYAGEGPPQPDVELAVESHAWVEALIPGWGWFEIDPTNDCPADERHVTVAVGRDYRDVSPVRGTRSGGAGASLDVQVAMIMPGANSGRPGVHMPRRPVVSVPRRPAAITPRRPPAVAVSGPEQAFATAQAQQQQQQQQ